jgi:rubrerythrin
MIEKKASKPKTEKPVLTAEQAEALKVLNALKVANAKKHQEDLNIYSVRVEKMTDRQLHSELQRTVKNEKGQAGLTAAFGVVLRVVLEGTKTPQNPFGKLQAYPR